jgi:transcriptional/translational regulatory protein YebC/TACO1
VLVATSTTDLGEDDVMMVALEAGADDLVVDGETWKVSCEPSLVFEVRDHLRASGLEVLSADAPLVSDNLVPITEIDEARRVLKVLEAIEDNDDVQDVYSNFDIDDSVMEAATQ